MAKPSQVVIILGVTAAALISVQRGISGGVKLMSNINMVIALALMAFVLVVGPTGQVVGALLVGVGPCATDLLALSNPFGRGDDTFRQDWTSFYWAWWISVSPFVGMFSRGRTVRGMAISAILVPSAVCILWMCVFGGTAIDWVVTDPEGSAVKDIVINDYDAATALFAMLAELPLAAVTSTIAVALVPLFPVTTSDSGSLVIHAIATGGKTDVPVNSARSGPRSRG